MKKIILIICTLFFVLNVFIVNASITISDTVVEKQTKVFALGFKTYELTLYNADSTGVRFSINGQLTRLLNTGDFDIISDANISVNKIDSQLGSAYVANFTIFIAGCHRCDFGMSCTEDNCCNGKEIKEIDFTSDNENCGSCNNKCSSGTKCDNGNCISTQISSDLSNYPDFLIKNDQLEFTTAVGDKSSSINVVAQTNVLSSLSGLGKSMSVKNKLASEITDLNQNIISFGNPCVNDISAKIMGNPQPCDKDFQRGKGYIKLYKNNGFSYLVVTGYTDLGTRKAAEILSNYKNYQFQGSEYMFQFSSDGETTVKTDEKKENTSKIEVMKSSDKTQSEENQDVQNKNETDQKPEIKENITLAVNNSEQAQNQTEKPNVVKKFISWFLSLFKK